MNQLSSVCVLAVLLQLIFPPYIFSFSSLQNWVAGSMTEKTYEEHKFMQGGTLTVNNPTSGSTTIKTWGRPVVVVNAIKHIKEKKPKPEINFSIKEKQAYINVRIAENVNVPVELELMVPEQTNISVNAKGAVKIKSIDGTIYAKTAGPIDVRHIGNCITALSESSCTISLHTVPVNCKIDIFAHDTIDLALPPETNATLHAKAEYGTISCQHFFTFKPFCTKLNKTTWNQMRKEINGYLGNPPLIDELSKIKDAQDCAEFNCASIELRSKNKSINILNNRD